MAANRLEFLGIIVSIILMLGVLTYLSRDTSAVPFEATQDTSSEPITTHDEELYDVLSENVDRQGNVSTVIIDEIIIGEGQEVIVGDRVTVHYIGTLKDGTQIDNTYVKGEPFTFTVGEDNVIAGWNEGVLGMKVGGERILIIPPEKAYGDTAVGPVPANATLIYAIELLSIAYGQE